MVLATSVSAYASYLLRARRQSRSVAASRPSIHPLKLVENYAGVGAVAHDPPIRSVAWRVAAASCPRCRVLVVRERASGLTRLVPTRQSALRAWKPPGWCTFFCFGTGTLPGVGC